MNCYIIKNLGDLWRRVPFTDWYALISNSSNWYKALISRKCFSKHLPERNWKYDSATNDNLVPNFSKLKLNDICQTFEKLLTTRICVLYYEIYFLRVQLTAFLTSGISYADVRSYLRVTFVRILSLHPHIVMFLCFSDARFVTSLTEERFCIRS